MSVRVFTLAKQLKVDNKTILDACLRLGFGAKNAISSLSDDEADKIRELLTSEAPTQRSVSFPSPRGVFTSGKMKNTEHRKFRDQ